MGQGADGNATTISGEGVTYDALGRMVEINNSGTYTQNMYSPTGFLMEIPSLQKKFVPLPAGAQVVYTSNAPGGGYGYYYRHADWLGSIRLASTTSRTMYYDLAYSPYGTPYSVSGPADYTFTGVEHNFPNLYDFPAREFAIQGRWPSPDPAGLAAVDATNPQTWNRYAYVLNNPLSSVDPLGYECVWDNGSFDSEDDPNTGNRASCEGTYGGTWIDHSFFTDFGFGDWSGSAIDDLAGVVSAIQAGFGLVQTGTGAGGWMLVANGGLGPIDWSLLGPPPPSLEQQRLLTLKAAGVMVERDMGCIAIPGAGLLAGGTAFQLGMPTRQKPFAFQGSSDKTSTASEALRDAFPQKAPFRIPTPVDYGTKISGTRSIGAAAGRYVPVAGLALAGYSGYKMTQCLNQKP